MFVLYNKYPQLLARLCPPYVINMYLLTFRLTPQISALAQPVYSQAQLLKTRSSCCAQVVASTGIVVVPYNEYPQLLAILLRLLSEGSQPLRISVIKASLFRSGDPNTRLAMLSRVQIWIEGWQPLCVSVANVIAVPERQWSLQPVQRPSLTAIWGLHSHLRCNGVKCRTSCASGASCLCLPGSMRSLCLHLAHARR